VRIIIDEGRQFRYGPHSLSGSYDTKYGQQLNKIASKLKEGNLVNPFQLRQAQFDMKTLLANNGYPYAEVSYVLDTLSAPAMAHVDFRVEGDSVVQFGNVKIEALTNSRMQRSKG